METAAKEGNNHEGTVRKTIFRKQVGPLIEINSTSSCGDTERGRK